MRAIKLTLATVVVMLALADMGSAAGNITVTPQVANRKADVRLSALMLYGIGPGTAPITKFRLCTPLGRTRRVCLVHYAWWVIPGQPPPCGNCHTKPTTPQRPYRMMVRQKGYVWSVGSHVLESWGTIVGPYRF